MSFNVYQRRQPEKTDLYKAVAENLDLFYENYDEQYLDDAGPLRKTTRKALQGFLNCGRLRAGFARVRCEDCGEELLVGFSCQCRGVCPSCQQKRAEILCRYIEEEVALPVDHRQLVFVIPKHLRGPFYKEKKMLTGLCRAAVDATQEFYRAGLGRDDVSVGMVVIPQYFGDKVNSHIHLHALATDGAFDKEGNFHRLLYDMSKDIDVLRRLFEKKLLDFMVSQKRLNENLREEMLSWEHTGFSTDGSVRVFKGDLSGLKRLVRYMARPGISFGRVKYDQSTGQVTIFSAKKEDGVRPMVAQYDALTFLGLLTMLVPPKGCHLTRYYGYYSVRSRASRRKDEQTLDLDSAIHEIKEIPSPQLQERRRRWAELIRLVFEVDPLKCPSCGGQMNIIAFITESQPEVISKICDHIGESTEIPWGTGPPRWLEILQASETMQAHPEYYPDDMYWDEEEWIEP